jgi:ArsR family transcriptional regulator, arsenate/arsenite/antimonite-responsive transcriptional repressor
MPDYDSQALAELIKAFAHPTRLLILRELMNGPKCVTDMEDLLPARQANISQHLAVLRFAKLVDYAQDGVLRCYYLARPKLVEGLLDLVTRDHPAVKRTAAEIKAEKERAARATASSAASSRRRRARAKT